MSDMNPAPEPLCTNCGGEIFQPEDSDTPECAWCDTPMTELCTNCGREMVQLEAGNDPECAWCDTAPECPACAELSVELQTMTARAEAAEETVAAMDMLIDSAMSALAEPMTFMAPHHVRVMLRHAKECREKQKAGGA